MSNLPATCSPDKPRLESRNSDVSNVSTTYTEGGTKRVPPSKVVVGLAKSPDLKQAKSKIGSLNNIKHTPTGGSVRIQTQKLNWQAKSKVGSLDNKQHTPGGGKLKVESRKLEWNTTSKIQSLQNVRHKPGGGNVKIFDENYAAADKPKSRLPRANGSASPTNSQSSTRPAWNSSITKDESKLTKGSKMSLTKGFASLSMRD